VLGQILLFSVTGQKSIFFSVLIIVGIYFALRSRGKLFGLKVVGGLITVIIASSTLDKLFNSTFLSSLFVRRLMATPGLLTGYYYDFFSNHSKVFLAHSIFKPFLDYPYTFEPPFLIGNLYFNKPDMSANVNYIADAFSNFGYYGILFFTIILAIVLWIFDSVSKHSNYYLTILILSMSAWSLTDTALFTSLLTHGILFALCIVYLMPRHKDEEV
jgi:hypothetical protein